MSATVPEHGAGLSGRDAGTYAPHPLHAGGRAYLETNCYTDLLIELLHGTGREPTAMLGCLVRLDFEGDQFTFFKPGPEDLERLYGVDIHEMQLYRPLPAHIAEQLRRGRTMTVELDAWHLPDTAATSYRTEHVKTSVAPDWIDPDAQVLRYFHNTGLHELSGEDYRAVLGLDRAGGDDHLPPYAELVRFDAGEPLRGDALIAEARAQLRAHLDRRPAADPFGAFAEQLTASLPELLDGELAAYHAYAFATVRMAGSAAQLAGDYARWLAGDAAGDVVAALDQVVEGCKALSFRLARRRPFDPSERVSTIGAAWQRAVDGLADLAG